MAVTYAFGWHPSKPDIRDFTYKAPEPILRSLPPEFDLSVPSPGANFSKTWNQGSLGSCGPNTASENIVFDELKGGDTSPNIADRLFIYYNTRQIMGTVNSDSGVNNRDLIKSIVKWGYPDETSYDISTFTQKPSDAKYQEAAKRAGKIVYQSVPVVIDQIKACIFDSKGPVWLGIPVFQSMMTDTVARTGTIPMPTPFDRPVGGHDILMVGWKNGYMKIKNHWGDWGEQPGCYGWIPEQYVEEYASDLWSITGVPVDAAPTPTPPGPAPTPGTIQQIFDSIMEQIEKGITNPAVLVIVKWVQSTVDEWLSSHGVGALTAASPSMVQQIIDGVFAQLMTNATVFERVALRIVQGLVDRYLQSHGL